MKQDWEFIVYSHRQHPLHAQVAEAIFRLVPDTARLTIIREPGTAAQNSNRALDAARSRYLFLLDEDAILFQRLWLPAMLTLAAKPDFGIGSCGEVPNQEVAATMGPEAVIGGRATRRGWFPGYVLLMDLMRCKGLRFDENIPGAKAMSDVDICLQARARGLGCWLHKEAHVIHLEKPQEAGPRRAAGFTSTIEEEHSWGLAQAAYMTDKWGPRWLEI